MSGTAWPGLLAAARSVPLPGFLAAARSAPLPGLLAAARSAPLPGFLAGLAPLLDHYGYWAIAALLLLENIGVPVVPGEFSLIAGAIYAGTGHLNVAAVGVTAVIAAFAGAEIGYGIGRFGGRTLVERYGRYVLLRPHHLDRAETVVTRYGGVVVVVARFIVGLRELNGIIAGITGMRWARFLIYNAIGAAAWVALWVCAGYFAGDHIGTIYHDAVRYSYYLLIVLLLAVAALIARTVLRRRRRLAAAGPDVHRAGPGRSAPAGPATQPSPGRSAPAGPATQPSPPRPGNPDQH
jgi:membrane protein DedA with SNARE-associated domain